MQIFSHSSFLGLKLLLQFSVKFVPDISMEVLLFFIDAISNFFKFLLKTQIKIFFQRIVKFAFFMTKFSFKCLLFLIHKLFFFVCKMRCKSKFVLQDLLINLFFKSRFNFILQMKFNFLVISVF